MNSVTAAMHATTGIAGFLVGLCFLVVVLGLALFARRLAAFRTDRNLCDARASVVLSVARRLHANG